MPISYKNKIYTTLGTPTVLSGDVVSATDNAGVPVKDYTVKGKTIVWNQLFDKNSIPNRNSTAITYSVDGNINILTTTDVIATSFFSFLCPTVSGHKYMICARSLEWNSPNHSNLFIGDSGHPDTASYATLTPSDLAKTFTATNETCYIKSYISYSAGNYEFKMNGLQLFDLTQMFGAGNEPATPAEFRAMFPDDYYPYNAGELKSIAPTSVESSGIERFQLLDKNKYPATTTIGGVTFTNNGDGTITVNGTARPSDHIYYGLHNVMEVPVGHKVLISGGVTGAGWSSYLLYDASDATYGIDSPGGGKIYTVQTNQVDPYIFVAKSYTVSNITFKPQLFDLTQMFGPGNEPTTPAEFWQKVPEKLYGYNPSAYKSVNIPSSKYFPDGMKSAGSVYDEINFLSQKAIKRIGAVDMGALTWTLGGGNGKDEVFYATISGKKTNLNIVCDRYTTSSEYWEAMPDKSITSNKVYPLIYIKDFSYTDAAAFKAAMSGVMLYYELATPVETTITPPLQALSTYKGFTSFSAPNSLMQNGPLSVTHYAEGGANPEKGWLTSYKRKLYMGRTIEWNQLLDKSKFAFTGTYSKNGVDFINNGDGTYTVTGTASQTTLAFIQKFTVSMPAGHVYYVCGIPESVRSTNDMRFGAYSDDDGVFFAYNTIVTASSTFNNVRMLVNTGRTANNVLVKPQLFDLTQMFGAGNEPTTPAEFWQYFDNKYYPYNAGETQPLFKISRKSQWGALPKHYTARWDKVHSAMVRLNDAASFPTDITNFAHRGSVNTNYSNPFDNIYPWSGIKLCNISIDLYRNLAAGDSITQCVTAWEGDENFSYNDANGVWRYRPEFWGKSWEDDTYRYFDVTDQNVPGSNYVHYPEAIVGRWHGRAATLTVGGTNKACLVPSVGMPANHIVMRNLHTYAKNYGATIDSIFSIDADVLLCIVEFATMNTQKAIGNGVSNLYRQSSDLIQEDATNSNVVKVLASAASAFCIPGAIFEIGTSNGGVQVGSFTVVSVAQNAADAKYLDVTLDKAVTVTAANYWSVHGIINVADEEIGSKSGYIGTNGKCNAYYRGIVMFGNMWLYTLGAYENKDGHHIWIANSDEEADNYDALDTTVHYDTGLVLPTAGGYTKKLGLLSRSGLLSIPAFCVETGGDSSNPVGDYFYNGSYTYNTVLLRGGHANNGSNDGAFYGSWHSAASDSNWSISARPHSLDIRFDEASASNSQTPWYK